MPPQPVGSHEPGALLPFLIEDVTPRTLRVQPSVCVAEHDADGSLKPGGLSGIACVVLAVTAIAPALELFQRVFACGASRRGSSARLGAELVALDSVPVVLAAPADEATIWFEKARNYTPAHPNIRAQLAAAHALKGDSEHAAAELAEACRLSGDDRYTSITRVKATQY